MNVPCPTCPWRRESAGGPSIPNFDIDKARHLVCTVGAGDDFRPIMACHGSPEDEEYPCVGYVAVEGYSNLTVRLAAIDGRIDLGAITEACKDIDLHGSFDDMLDALEDAEL